MLPNGRELFQRIMEEQYPVMILAARKVVGTNAQAEDVVLCILEQICRDPHVLDTVSDLRVFLVKIVHREALRRCSELDGKSLLLNEEVKNEGKTKGDFTSFQKNRKKAKQMLKRMSPSEREAFKLVQIRGMEAKDAARRLRIGESELQELLRRAMTLFGEYFEQGENEKNEQDKTDSGGIGSSL